MWALFYLLSRPSIDCVTIQGMNEWVSQKKPNLKPYHSTDDSRLGLDCQSTFLLIEQSVPVTFDKISLKLKHHEIVLDFNVLLE